SRPVVPAERSECRNEASEGAMRPEYALGFAKLDNPGMLLWRKSPEPAMRGKSDLQESAALAAIAEAPPHYHGHRKRLRARFGQAGAQGLAEYELLELVLFRALPRRDVKPIAKKAAGKIRLVRRSDLRSAGAARGNLRSRRGGDYRSQDRPGG